MILGLHCSLLQGFASALQYARGLGCGAMQVFPGRRRGTHGEAELEGFRRERQASGLRLVAHSRFAPCLASSARERRSRSIELLEGELRLCEAMGAEVFILHAGAYSEGSDRAQGLRLAAQSALEALERSGWRRPVLFENVTGGGRRLGGGLEDLAELLGPLHRAGRPAGVCIDSAHAWAAGFELATGEGMLRFLARLDRVVGAENVRAFHLNDTRAALGSQRENHAAWGEGWLGSEGLRALLARPEFADRPGIIELPLGAGLESSRASLAFVRALG